MNRETFHQAILKLWMESQVPLTVPNIMAHSGLVQSKVKKHLDRLVVDGTIQMDVDDDGILVWSIPDARRHSFGATSMELYGVKKSATGVEKPSRSMTLSAILSFFFGPLGWLYAAPMRAAVPGSVLYVLMCSIVPQVFLPGILGITAPLSAILGGLWAWKFNRTGQRTPLLVDGKDGNGALP